jgi:hypothetical protein
VAHDVDALEVAVAHVAHVARHQLDARQTIEAGGAPEEAVQHTYAVAARYELFDQFDADVAGAARHADELAHESNPLVHETPALPGLPRR